jgi:hypothetical protein
MKEIEVKKHQEKIVVESALVDEKDETQIYTEIDVFVNEPYSYLADSVAATIIGMGEKIHKNIKGAEAKKTMRQIKFRGWNEKNKM